MIGVFLLTFSFYTDKFMHMRKLILEEWMSLGRLRSRQKMTDWIFLLI